MNDLSWRRHWFGLVSMGIVLSLSASCKTQPEDSTRRTPGVKIEPKPSPDVKPNPTPQPNDDPTNPGDSKPRRFLDFDADIDEGSHIRATWIPHHYYSDPRFDPDKALEEIKRARFNTIYISVYNQGEARWNSSAFKRAGGVAATDKTLFDFVEKLKAAGVRVAAWFEYGLALYPSNHPIAVNHPDWLQRDMAGEIQGNETQVFMSPSHPKVVELLSDMVAEITKLGIFDEIQLDRFRYTRMTSEGREFGYEAVTADLYQKRFKQSPPTDKNEAGWVQFREERVNDLVKSCYKAIKNTDEAMLVSIAPVGHYGIRQHMQRWSAWLKEGAIDYVAIQVYNMDIDAFKSHLDRQITELESIGRLGDSVSKNRIVIGLRAHETTDAQQTIESIEYLRSKGFFHTSLWAFHHFNRNDLGIADDLELLLKPKTHSTWNRFRYFEGWQGKPKHPFIRDPGS
ncbi:MAG: family 10 glycosylhydrolase [Pseudobacteriovorax sp.]|nr:family 10 glycosylhydrolase [Pseudobacteriovorax sp.]